MKTYNDLLTKSTTSTSVDKDTWKVYTDRNCAQAGRFAPEEDQAPYFMPGTEATKKIKKIYK